jgi:hypothetical protein
MSRVVAVLLVLLSIWAAGILVLDRRGLEARADNPPRVVVSRISNNPYIVRVVDEEWNVVVYVAGGGVAAVKVPWKAN